MKISADNAEGIVILLAAAGAAYLLYKTYSAASGAVDSVSTAVMDAYNAVSDSMVNTAAGVNDALNPTKSTNIAYQGANKVARVVTGDPTQTYGGWAYDYTHTNGKPNNGVVGWFDGLILN